MAVKDLIQTKKCLFLCNGGSCMKKDAEEVTQAVRKCIKEMGLDDEYHTVRTKCIGRCDDAPVAMLAPNNVWLKLLVPDKCAEVLTEIEQELVEQSPRFLYKMGTNFVNSDSIPTKQRRKN